MIFLAFLRCSILLSFSFAIAAADEETEDHLIPHGEIEVLDDSALNALGYEHVFKSECDFAMRGAPEGKVMTQEEETLFDSLFLKAFNKVQTQIFSHDEHGMPDVLALAMEPVAQVPAQATNVLHRQLRGVDQKQRRAGMGYMYKGAATYSCGFCWSDNRDKRQLVRQLEEPAESVAEKLEVALLASGSVFFTDISCVQITCDGTEFVDESGSC